MSCTSLLYCPSANITATVRTYRDVTYSYTQLWQHFPFLSPLYASFEKNYDPRPSFEFIMNNWWLIYTAISLYLLMIVFLPRVFKSKPLKVDKALAYWNLFLAIYSAMGAIRVVPHLLWYMSNYTFKETVCTPPYFINGDGATGLWVTLFTFSKVIELFDTLFICLKGKKPIFLHWYHHVSVLFFCWAAHEAAHPGFYFIAMNYTVHSVMYTYYYLMAIKSMPKWFNPMWITFMQIAQMIVGVTISVMGFVYSKEDPSCGVNPWVLKVSAVIYASYLYLFMEFMIKRFFINGGKAIKGSPKKAKKDL